MVSRDVTGSVLCVFLMIAGSSSAIGAPAPVFAPHTPAFSARILESHNAERKRVGVPLLAWDAKLATDAASWASHIAASGKFEHAPINDRDPEGENLWIGTQGAYSPEEMVGAWIEERADFVAGIFPRVTRTTHWEDVGHYTQLIWRTTSRVGCALAHNLNNDILVCRYADPGNWIGENPLGK